MTLTRRLEFHANGSNKYWEVAVNGATHTVRWGRCGTTGQTQTKTFPTVDKAVAAAESAIAQKVAKGYDLIDGPSQAADPNKPPAAPIPRLFPMLASEVEVTSLVTYAQDDRYVFEAKLDGHRVMLRIAGGEVTAIGRNGQVSQHNPRFQTGLAGAELERLRAHEMILDGELMPDGVLWLFDMPSLGRPGDTLSFGFDDPWLGRRTALHALFRTWAPRDAVFRLLPFAQGTEAKIALVKSQHLNKGEGVVIKRTGAPYQPCARNADTMKAKFIHEADLVVLAVRPNGKDNATLGAYRDGEMVEIGQTSLIGKPKVVVGSVVCVRYLYLGAGNRIVQPRLMSVRTDKAADECLFSQLVGTNKEAGLG